jgi:hypothetical protein
MAEITAERQMSRADVAEYFHMFANKLDPSEENRQTEPHNIPDGQDPDEPSETAEEATGDENVEPRQEWAECAPETTTDEPLS